MAASSGRPLSFSQVPGNPSFRNSAVNFAAVIPLLSSDKDGEIATTHSAQSFSELLQALRRHSQTEDEGSQTRSANDNKDNSENSHLLVVPNSSLTRPGDWRYADTPLKAFHWQHGCQRLHVFDGRPASSRQAHDRLINHGLTRDWIDLCPSRRTAAVIGVLNMRDCRDLADLHRAEEELHQWAERYSTPPYEVTVHGRSFDRDRPVERLFVYDSFDEECQKIDLSQSGMGNNILAFPPADEEHAMMMDLHMNVVVNDLAVAIFRQLETKIRDSDAISKGVSSSATQADTQTSTRRSLTRIISGSSDKDGEEEPVQSSKALSLSNMATLVSPDSKLAAQDSSSPDSKEGSSKSTISSGLAEAASRLSGSGKSGIPKPRPPSTPQLLTPMDDTWDLSELSAKDAEAVRKRDIGRREKYAADLSLLAGSPLDAYERYLKAAELCKTGTPDPLWYASALEGCAAAHIAMAETGGYSVDEYLENNFQLPEEIMALAKKDTKEDKRQSVSTSSKQTMPEVIFALCEEALNITNRHAKLAPFNADLLLKLALYSSESAEGHLRCRWGEGEGCYGGEQGDTPRWLKPSVSKMKFGSLKAGENDMIAINTFNRTKKFCELLQDAVAVGALDAASRVDVAVRSARMCLEGVRATQWKKPNDDRIKLPRKAAYFAAVAAEAISIAKSDGSVATARDLWLLATQLYPSRANSQESGGNYGWASLRAFCLAGLALQGNSFVSLEAAELLLSLLGEISSEPEGNVFTKKKSAETMPKEREEAVASSTDARDANPATAKMGHTSERALSEVSEARSSATEFAQHLRESFTTMTASSTFLTVESKWADDEAIKPLNVPLGETSPMSSSIPALSCVFSGIDSASSASAQQRCMDRIVALRRSLPTSSSIDSESGSSGATLPLYVSSATVIEPESSLELECVKKRDASSPENQGVMATFFNPFDSARKSSEPRATRIAEGEEHTMVVRFGNRLGLPLEVHRCQLVFDNDAEQQIKATTLSFVIPPKSSDFAVHFPFTVQSGRSLGDGEVGNHDAFVSEGMNVTCLGRSFFVPIQSLGDEGRSETSLPSSLPKSASEYPYRVGKKRDDDAKATELRLEAYPCQPRLQIVFAKSGAPVEKLSIGLSDGEVMTLALFRLENYSGPSGGGEISQLQIFAVALPGRADEKLFDSDSPAALEEEPEDDFVKELMQSEFPPALKLRTLAGALKLDSINRKDNVSAESDSISFQIAAAHNMGAQLPDGATLHLRFRYRGVSTLTTEVWRTRDIALRIVGVKGPRISSMAFRPDLEQGSGFADMCESVGPPASAKVEEDLDDAAEDEDKQADVLTLKRMGVDPGVYVCGDKVVFVLTVANETSSAITLSRPEGAVGGFERNPLSTVVVHSGVSAKFPMVLPRIPRVDENGAPTDLVAEIVSRTSLFWESQQDGDEPIRGRTRIPPACLKEIIGRHPSFVSQACQPPCSIGLYVDKKASSDSPVTVSVGNPLNVSVEVSLASWIPEDALDNCSLNLEFLCTRKGSESNHARQTCREYIWAGKIRQKVALKDPEKKHRARLVFCSPGSFVVSACARISRKASSEKRVEEIWWAPVAQTFAVVDGSMLPAQ